VHPLFLAGYLITGIPLLAIELYGALVRRRKGDTISEMYWLVQGRFPVASRVLMGAFLAWLFVHFLFRR
jgi:hypothetical protein